MSLGDGPADAGLTDVRTATQLWLVPRANEAGTYSEQNAAKLATVAVSAANNFTALADGTPNGRSFNIHASGQATTPISLTGESGANHNGTDNLSWSLVDVANTERLLSWNAGTVGAFTGTATINASAVITVRQPDTVTAS